MRLYAISVQVRRLIDGIKGLMVSRGDADRSGAVKGVRLLGEHAVARDAITGTTGDMALKRPWR